MDSQKGNCYRWLSTPGVLITEQAAIRIAACPGYDLAAR